MAGNPARAVERREQVFGAPAQGSDPRAGQPLDEALGKGEAQIGAPSLDPGEYGPPVPPMLAPLSPPPTIARVRPWRSMRP